MDVSQSAVDYHDEDVEDDGGLGAKLRAVAVAPERMEGAGLPRPSPKNQDNLNALIGTAGLPAQRVDAVKAAAAAIAAAYNAIGLVDTGKPMVVQFKPRASA